MLFAIACFSSQLSVLSSWFSVLGLHVSGLGLCAAADSHMTALSFQRAEVSDQIAHDIKHNETTNTARVIVFDSLSS
jgi:hypothetical protein